jgi:hypothetical protein
MGIVPFVLFSHINIYMGKNLKKKRESVLFFRRWTGDLGAAKVYVFSDPNPTRELHISIVLELVRDSILNLKKKENLF